MLIHHGDSALTERVIGAAIEVHRTLGPGLLESVYERCLTHELAISDIPFERQVTLPVAYKGVSLDCSFRADLVVGAQLIVEVKSTLAIEPVHEAQLLTYMKLGNWRTGLLINFNVRLLKHGIRRFVL